MTTVKPTEEHTQAPVETSAERRRRRRTNRQGPPRIALVIVVVLAVLALLAPFLTQYTPVEGALSRRLVPPGGEDPLGNYHLLGTDGAGRDVLTRLLFGARVSLLVGVVGVAIAAVFGSVIGLISGVVGRTADVVLMRAVDIALSIPPILLAIIFASITTPSLTTVFIVIALLLWPNYARLVRGEVLTIRELDYVALARVAGCSRAKIAVRHIVPNVLPSIVVLATLHIGIAIILEASLSFLGVGLPPDAASWGSMVNDGRQYMAVAWWLTVLPGACIFFTVLSFNALGDWVRVRFDPRLDTVL